MRFLVIGYGSIGKRHAINLSNIYKKSDIFILSRKKNIIKKKKENNFKFLNIQDIKKLSRETFDAIFICSGANEHISLINKFFNTTNKIFVEKPLSNSTKNVSQVLSKIKKNKKNFLVGYNLLFTKSLIKLKKIIENKKDKILKVSVRSGFDLRKWRNINYEKTVSASKRKGGGVLLELSHEINNLIWLFGKPLWVSAHISKISNLKINTEDNVFMIIGFKDTIANLNLDFISKNYERSMTFYYKESTLKWTYLTNSIEKFSKNSKKMNFVFKGKKNLNNSYIDEIKFFLKNTNLHKFNELSNISFHTLRLIERARYSHQKKSVKVYI